MPNNKDVPKEQTPINKFLRYIKKNGFTVLMTVVLVVLLVSPDAKSFMLRQLVHTGLFNASIDSKDAGTSQQSAVDFDFDDRAGNVQNTASLRGKVVFINFWASWCPPCRAEFPSIQKLYSKFEDHPDVFFLMINEDDDIYAGIQYLENENYSMPLYRRSGHVPPEIYGGTLPTTIVLNKAGKVVLHHAGFANYGSDKFLKQMEALINE